MGDNLVPRAFPFLNIWAGGKTRTHQLMPGPFLARQNIQKGKSPGNEVDGGIESVLRDETKQPAANEDYSKRGTSAACFCIKLFRQQTSKVSVPEFSSYKSKRRSTPYRTVFWL